MAEARGPGSRTISVSSIMSVTMPGPTNRRPSKASGQTRVAAPRANTKTPKAKPRPRNKKVRTLAKAAPHLLLEWHTARNEGVDAGSVTASSSRLYWWRCPKGPDHEWRANVWNRAGLGHGCPFCAGRKVSVTTSLATVNPRVAAEWHPTLNGALKPQAVTRSAARKIWWACRRNAKHVWQASLGARDRGQGCPFCAGKRTIVEESLAVRFPAIAAQWDRAKNGGVGPETVPVGSHRAFWWRCSSGPDHRWHATADNRTRRGGVSCPYCRQRSLSVTNCLATVAPALKRQWHPTRNHTLTPRTIIATSGTTVWWRCPFGHDFRATPFDRVSRGVGCPPCGADGRSRRRRKPRHR